MPVGSLKTITARTPTKIAEVNVNRETLTIFNFSPYLGALADDDQPLIEQDACHGIPIYPYTRLTLEKKDGDQPDHPWYIYFYHETRIIVFEGMKPAKQWWSW